MGPAGSASWNAILDSAQRILRDEGYGALSSRHIAEQMGIKQRLIYYYFSNMDDLIVHLFRRLAERDLLRLAKTLSSPRPMHELWHLCVHTEDARLVAEFMALANRNEGLRAEVATFIEESRRLQAAALRKAMAPTVLSRGPSPAALALLASSLGLLLVREAQVGVTAGHVEVAALVGDFLGELEPKPKTRSPARVRRSRIK
jgi:AcrR family transcriptional regulator